MLGENMSEEMDRNLRRIKQAGRKLTQPTVTYPVFFQYGKYSVNLSELTEKRLEEVRKALAPLNIELVYNGRNH